MATILFYSSTARYSGRLTLKTASFAEKFAGVSLPKVTLAVADGVLLCQVHVALNVRVSVKRGCNKTG